MSESQPTHSRRPGFALFCAVLGLILLLTTTSYAQWYENPQAPTYNWPGYGMGDATMCTDGCGGAFFAVAVNFSYTVAIGHVNGAGELTYHGWLLDGLLPVDSSGFGEQSGGLGMTLVPSEPPGTVIGLSLRFHDDNEGNFVCVGMVIDKFDTLGLTGFGSVAIADPNHLFRPRPGLSEFTYSGNLDAHSDGHSGLHVVVDSVLGFPPSYYNHLRADGTWRYPWPGLLVAPRDSAQVVGLTSDGYGGVVLGRWWNNLHPTYPNQYTLQRFNAGGDPTWEEGRVRLRGDYWMTGNLLL
jgi:hypothetical protein